MSILARTALLFSLAPLAACSGASDPVQVSMGGACAWRYEFAGTVYEDYSKSAGAELLHVGKELGTAYEPACIDNPNSQTTESPSNSVTVYKYRELSTQSAIAVDIGGKRMRLFATKTSDHKLNEEVQRFLKQARSTQGS